MLTGVMVGAVVAYLIWRKRLPWSWTIARRVGLLIIAAGALPRLHRASTAIHAADAGADRA